MGRGEVRRFERSLDGGLGGAFAGVVSTRRNEA
jgi:hypothetical protein